MCLHATWDSMGHVGTDPHRIGCVACDVPRQTWLSLCPAGWGNRDRRPVATLTLGVQPSTLHSAPEDVSLSIVHHVGWDNQS